MLLKNIIFIGFAALILQACGHYSEDLAALENPALQDIAPAGGGDFLAALSGQYMTIARKENDELYDYTAAKYFTNKAKKAQQGEMVYPASLSEFDIPAEKTQKAQELRARLMSALQTQNSFENAYTLAKAQAQFDHWLENLDEASNEEQSAQCEAKLEDALGALSEPVMNEVNYTVYFGEGSSSVGGGSQTIIKDVATFYKENPFYDVIVIGYAGQEASRGLAAQRAISVRDDLVKAGVPGYLIRIYQEGEQAAFTPVSDSMNEQQNRRANIILRLQNNRFL